MMKRSLTCIVPCRNEAANIQECIASFRHLADEIIVADSGSTDQTMAMAAEATDGRCRIIEREYRWSGDFKNWAISHATHDWILIVDADERITPELASEIGTVLSSSSPMDGYWIYRQNHFLGHRLRYAGMQHDCCLRLFRRSVAEYVGLTDHAEVRVRTSRVGSFRSRMLHYTAWDWDQYLAKLKRYSEWQAEVWYNEGRDSRYRDLLLRAPFRFLRDFILQLGFLDGKIGLQYCVLQSWYAFMKQARLWERHHARVPSAANSAGESAVAKAA